MTRKTDDLARAFIAIETINYIGGDPTSDAISRSTATSRRASAVVSLTANSFTSFATTLLADSADWTCSSPPAYPIRALMRNEYAERIATTASER